MGSEMCIRDSVCCVDELSVPAELVIAVSKAVIIILSALFVALEGTPVGVDIHDINWRVLPVVPLKIVT